MVLPAADSLCSDFWGLFRGCINAKIHEKNGSGGCCCCDGGFCLLKRFSRWGSNLPKELDTPHQQEEVYQYQSPFTSNVLSLLPSVGGWKGWGGVGRKDKECNKASGSPATFPLLCSFLSQRRRTQLVTALPWISKANILWRKMKWLRVSTVHHSEHPPSTETSVNRRRNRECGTNPRGKTETSTESHPERTQI